MGLLLQNLEIKRKKPTWVSPCELQLQLQTSARKSSSPRGYQKLGAVGALYRTGVTRRFFFWEQKTFDYFSEIKDFKRSHARDAGATQASSSTCAAYWAWSAAFGCACGGIIFCTPRGSKLWGLGRVPLGCLTQIAAKFPKEKFFIGPPPARGASQSFCRIAWTTAWQRRADFCEFRKTFFGRRFSEKTPRNSPRGGVGRSEMR